MVLLNMNMCMPIMDAQEHADWIEQMGDLITWVFIWEMGLKLRFDEGYCRMVGISSTDCTVIDRRYDRLCWRREGGQAVLLVLRMLRIARVLRLMREWHFYKIISTFMWRAQMLNISILICLTSSRCWACRSWWAYGPCTRLLTRAMPRRHLPR